MLAHVICRCGSVILMPRQEGVYASKPRAGLSNLGSGALPFKKNKIRMQEDAGLVCRQHPHKANKLSCAHDPRHFTGAVISGALGTLAMLQSAGVCTMRTCLITTVCLSLFLTALNVDPCPPDPSFFTTVKPSIMAWADPQIFSPLMLFFGRNRLRVGLTLCLKSPGLVSAV